MRSTWSTRSAPVRLRDAIARTLDTIAPSASALGCERELTGVERILRNGNGADRQLETFAATGDTRAVARDVASRGGIDGPILAA